MRSERENGDNRDNKKGGETNRNKNVVPMDKRRRKKRKKNGNKSGAITLIILFAIAVIFLIGPTVIKTMTGSMTGTGVLKSGIIEQSFSTKAIIVRDETVLKSSLEGVCISTYSEGEKVPNGATVATVIDSSSKELTDKIKSLNVRISKAKDEALSSGQMINEEIKSVDENIENNIKKFSEMFASGDITTYSQVYNDIEILLDQKADLKNTDIGNSSYLEQLISQRDQLENTIKGKMENIINDTPGIVSYSVDGFEKEIKPSVIENISVESFESLAQKIESGKETADKTECAKIITDINYYFACSVKYDDISGMSKGDAVDIRINQNNLVISAQVEKIVIEGKNAVIVFKADRALSETTLLRLVDIDVITGQTKGIKVPKKALSNINYIENKAEVAVIKSGYVYYVDAKIKAMSGEYAIIENLDPEGEITFDINDFIIINPEKVNEGQVIG